MRYSKLIALCSYAVIVVIVFSPILFPPAGMLLFGSDIHRSYHFFRQLFHDSISTGQFPWWNPYLFSGEPLIANPSVAFWYPFNWLFAVLPYRFVYSWIIPIHIFIAMTGMYVFSSKFKIQNSKLEEKVETPFDFGAFIAGLIFGLSGYFMGRIWEGHVELILAASWMPWVIFTNVQCQMSNAKWKTQCVIAAVVFAIQLYAGYHTIALFTLEAVLIVTLLHCYIVKNIRPLLPAILSIIIGLGLAGLQIIPSQEFFSRSIRTYELPYSWAVFGSYTVENLKQIFQPFILGGPESYSGPSPNFGEMAAYIGVVPLVLALLGIVWAIKRRAWISIAMMVIALFGLWISFGWNAPVDLNKILWDSVPTYKYLRIPSRHLILFVFGMSFLAGVGLSFARRVLAKLIISLVIVVDLVWFAKTFVTLAPDPSTRHSKELVGYLQKNLGLARILPNFNVGMGTRDALDFDAAMGYKFFSASGYDPSILRNYYEFAAAAGKIENPDVQRSDVQIPYLVPQSRYTDFLNIKYIFVPSWFDSVAGSSKFSPVLAENIKDFWKLYENKNIFPRFFLAPSLVVFPTRDGVARAIRNEDYNPSETILVESSSIKNQSFSPSCLEKNLPPPEVLSYSYNRIELLTSSSCNAFLATSEVMYPGWSATIDGKKTEIFEGNLAFRTLWVPAGEHNIVLQYQPWIFVVGFFVSIATVAGCLIWTKKSAHSVLVVLDRDGTLIRNEGFIGRGDKWMSELVINAPVVCFLSYIQSKYKTMMIVVSNQSGVARGYFDEKRIREVNEAINELLKKQGITIDGWQFCPDVDAVYAKARPEIFWNKQYVKTATKRKPATKMVDDALGQLGKKIGDFDTTIVLGNSEDDAELARVLGAVWIDVRGASYEKLVAYL